MSVALLTAPGPAYAATAGSRGIGDDYFPADGNGGYDALRYGIKVRYDLATGTLTGRTRVKVRATKALSSLNLDLLLPVSKVRVRGVPAVFSKPSRHELRVRLKPALAAGETAVIAVSYGGRPADYAYLGEANWLANSREMVAMNQPHMAPWWFPSNDHPRDRAKIRVRASVPRGLEAVSNGLLRSKKRVGDRTAWVWSADEPMVPYLAFLAVGDFSLQTETIGARKSTRAVSKRLSAARLRKGHAWLAKETQVIDWMNSQVGSYPFSASGGLITSLPVYFALENQTRPTYASWGIGDTSLLVHELAHQWFGDSVSVNRWRDIWLNEGFATYYEALWREQHGGSSALEWARLAYDSHPAGTAFWRVSVGDPGAARIFDDAVYDRGAMTLVALRERIGDSTFSDLMRTWYAERAGGPATTEQFIALAELKFGQQLDGLFDDWLYSTHRPPRP